MSGTKAAQVAFVEELLGPEARGVELSRLAPGTTNLVFLATTGTAKYVVRVFGEGTDKIIDRDRELSAFVLCGSGKVFARFANGAILSYAEGNPIPIGPVKDASLRSKIAVALARMHSRNSRPSTSENDLLKMCETFIRRGPEEAQERLMERYEEYRAALEARLGEEALVLVHGDPAPQNMVVCPDGELAFVDFEYSGWSWAQSDLAAHFNESTGLELRLSDYPSMEVQREFVETYLRERLGVSPERAEVEKWLGDVKLLASFLSFTWGAWGTYQAAHSTIKFAYNSYTTGRFAMAELDLPLPEGDPRLEQPLVAQFAPEA
jgi:ethanolamine kinase